MTEHSHFTPPDPELETTEFLQDIAGEMFLYQQWLEKVATEQKLDVTGYTGRLYNIPAFLYSIPGISRDVMVNFSCHTSADNDRYSFDTVTLATEDYPYAIKITDDHGLFVIEHAGNISLAPPAAQQAIIEALFSQRDRIKPQKDLIEYLAKHSHQSTKESVFETIGENDNSVKITMINQETEDNSSLSLEVTTREHHPSNALVGTRLTMFDSLESAMNADSSMSVIPNATVNLDVHQPRPEKKAFLLAPLSALDQTFHIPVPKKYHEGHIIEALFALEQAAKAA